MTETTIELVDPLLPVPRIGRLDRASDIRTELARLYRAGRRGDVLPADAARLGYLLNLLAKMIELSDIEARITALEEEHARH